MKRFIAGMTLAAGTVLSNPVHAEAQITDAMCVPVYDETQGDSSPLLRSVIEKYATSGIDVHVQILKDGGGEGFRGGSEAEVERQGEEFSLNLTKRCTWGDETVSVVVSLDPRARYVYENTSAIEESDLLQASGRFVANLRNASTSIQSDVAMLLQDINPNRPVGSIEPQHDEQLYVPEETTEEPQEPIDIPFKPILIAMSGAAMTAAATGRFVRGSRIKRAVSQGLSGTYDPVSTVTITIELAESSTLKILDKTEGEKLRSLVSQASTENSELSGAVGALLALYKRKRFLPWPDKSVIVEQSEAVAQMATALTATSAELTEEHGRKISLIANIEIAVPNFSNLLLSTRQQANGMVESGWNIDGYIKVLDQLDAVKNQVAELTKDYLFEKPTQLIEEGTKTAMQLASDMNGLPERREGIDLIVTQQPTITAEKSELIKNTEATLGSLKANYDESCYSEMKNADADLSRLHKELETFMAEAGAHVKVKSLTAVEQTEELVSKFKATSEKIDALARAVAERLVEVEEIKANLPAQIEDMKDDLELAHEYAFKKHMDDVEDDARKLIEDTVQTLQKFEKDEVEVTKPHYLDLRDSAKTQADAIEAAAKLAHEQKTEMDMLRTTRAELIETANVADSSHDTYVVANASDIDEQSEKVAERLEPQAIDMTINNRAGLREQVAILEEFIRQVKEAHGEAKEDVAREEAKRAEIERARQAAALALEQERQRQQLAQQRQHEQSRTSSGFGGSFGGGGGGGSKASGAGGSW